MMYEVQCVDCGYSVVTDTDRSAKALKLHHVAQMQHYAVEILCLPAWLNDTTEAK
jgi:hypothetical protein